MSRNQRLGLLAAAVAVLVAGFIALRPDNDKPADTTPTATAPPPADAQRASTLQEETVTPPPPPPAPTFETVRVVDGQPRGGVKTLKFTTGERVRIQVISDVADEVHVHGYDVSKDVRAGGRVRFSFPAKLEGRFEIELEHAGTPIAELEVSPQ